MQRKYYQCISVFSLNSPAPLPPSFYVFYAHFSPSFLYVFPCILIFFSFDVEIGIFFSFFKFEEIFWGKVFDFVKISAQKQGKNREGVEGLHFYRVWVVWDFGDTRVGSPKFGLPGHVCFFPLHSLAPPCFLYVPQLAARFC